jgi:hypothetical protein
LSGHFDAERLQIVHEAGNVFDIAAGMDFRSPPRQRRAGGAAAGGPPSAHLLTMVTNFRTATLGTVKPRFRRSNSKALQNDLLGAAIGAVGRQSSVGEGAHLAMSDEASGRQPPLNEELSWVSRKSSILRD